MSVKFSRPIAQLPVANVAQTQRYYRDVFGFTIDWTWGDNDYGSVSRDEAIIYLCATNDPPAPATLIIHVGDVDALHADWFARGAIILAPPDDMPWGIREFTVQDPNGHRLRLSQPSRRFTSPDRPALAGLRLEPRVPTPAEHRALAEAVGWSAFTDYDAAAASLPTSLFGVVACEASGACIGMSRVIGDGRQFFYVMDVAVHPEHQGRGIGTALMNEVVAFIQRAAPPKALVGLFTAHARGSFYERFGFRGPETGLYGMSAVNLRRVE